MTNTAKKLILFSVTLILTNGNAQEDNSENRDIRVEKILDSEGLEYTHGDMGYKLTQNFSDGRSQTYFVESETSKFETMEIRRIHSPVSISQEGIVPYELLLELLQENHGAKIGSWSILSVNDSDIIVFSVKIGANASSKTLLDAMRLVAVVSDSKEKEIRKEDLY